MPAGPRPQQQVGPRRAPSPRFLRAGRQHEDHRAALRGPEGRPRLRRGREARLEEKAGRGAQCRPDRGLSNKSDLDEHHLLAFFEQDDNTKIIAQHCEDLKDGRAFAEAAKRVSKKKPGVVLNAGRTAASATSRTSTSTISSLSSSRTTTRRSSRSIART